MSNAIDAKTKWQSAILQVIGNKKEQTQLPLVRENRNIITQFTEAVAILNRDYFYAKVKQRVQERLNFLHKIDSNTTALVDEWGRSTYFYVMIGPYKVLLYQPGTPTFFSSINKGSDLVTTHDDCQQNGPILGMGCGCFLADFLTHLSSTYQIECAKLFLDSHNFHPSVYESSLESSLKLFVEEDCDAHGRLLEIKTILLQIGGEYEIKSETIEFYFYAKDIRVYYGSMEDDTHSKNLSSELDRIKREDFMKMLDHRHQCSTYQQVDIPLQISDHSKSNRLEFINSETWITIRQQIACKNGIFENIEQSRKQLLVALESIEDKAKYEKQHTIIFQETEYGRPPNKKCVMS